MDMFNVRLWKEVGYTKYAEDHIMSLVEWNGLKFEGVVSNAYDVLYSAEVNIIDPSIKFKISKEFSPLTIP